MAIELNLPDPGTAVQAVAGAAGMTGNGGVTTIQAGQPGGSQAGIVNPASLSTNPNYNLQPVSDSMRRSMAAIDGLIGKTLEPVIQRKQQEQFLDGAARVMQGEAVKEIVDDQPFFSRLFGPGATQQGAQAMGAMARVADASTWAVESMPELRKQTPQEFRKTLTAQTETFMTGDPDTDFVIRKQLLEKWQPLMNMHVKEHYGYVQEQAKSAWYGLNMSNSKSFNKFMTMSDGTPRDPAVDDKAAMDLVAQLSQPSGVADKAYPSMLKDALTGMAESGDFHSISAARRGGLLNKLPPDDAAEIENKQNAVEQKLYGEVLGTREFGLPKVELLAAARHNAIPIADAYKAADALNKSVNRKYGTQSQYITEKELSAAYAQGLDQKYAAAEKADKGLAELDKEARTTRQNQAAFAVGNAGEIAALQEGGEKRMQLDVGVAYATILKDKNGGVAAADAVLIKNANTPQHFELQTVQAQFKATTDAAPFGYTDAVRDTLIRYKSWGSQPGGETAFRNYVGNEAYAKWVRFSNLMDVPGMDGKVATEIAFGAAQPAVSPPAGMTRDEFVKDGMSRAKSNLTTTLPTWLNGVIDPSKLGLNRAVEAGAPYAAQLISAGMPPDKAWEHAITSLNGEFVAGKLLLPGAGQVRMSSALGFTGGDGGRLMNSTVEFLLNKKVNVPGYAKTNLQDGALIRGVDYVSKNPARRGQKLPNLGFMRPDGTVISITGDEVLDAFNSDKDLHKELFGKKKAANTGPFYGMPVVNE